MSSELEQRLADELEATLAALDAGQAAPAGLLPAPEHHVAAALHNASRALTPPPEFARALEARLRAAPAPARRRPVRLRLAFAARPRTLWAAVAALLALVIVFAPPVRAGAVEVLRLGAIRIGLVPAPTPTPSRTRQGILGGNRPTPVPVLQDVAGQTTLATARQTAGFPILLPTYPVNLGPPDRVYLQHVEGTAVALVWVDPVHPDRARLTLWELTDSVFVYKSAPQVVQETTVGGQRALWTTGPYLVQVGNGSLERRSLVTGHALIWTSGGLTYRLETDGTLAEAVRIAESLR